MASLAALPPPCAPQSLPPRQDSLPSASRTRRAALVSGLGLVRLLGLLLLYLSPFRRQLRSPLLREASSDHAAVLHWNVLVLPSAHLPMPELARHIHFLAPYIGSPRRSETLSYLGAQSDAWHPAGAQWASAGCLAPSQTKWVDVRAQWRALWHRRPWGSCAVPG